MTGLAGFLILFGLLLFSVHERTLRIQKKYRGRQRAEEEMPVQGSALAESITQTVGIAGGIYISILTAINFLKLEAPETFNFWGVTLDPIAITALAATILQPFALTVRDKFLR